jgi:hypothetical protein
MYGQPLRELAPLNSALPFLFKNSDIYRIDILIWIFVNLFVVVFADGVCSCCEGGGAF